MARNSTQHVCQECGATANKWAGKCESCSAWNSMAEEAAASSVPKGLGAKKGRKIEFVGLKGTGKKIPRRIIGIAELDRVTGGGLVPGSALLVGGDPGIGKSTLLLQATAALSKTAECVYISGEESIDQLRLRAERLGLAEAPVRLAAATSVR
ncbi:MAG: ATPase domain-containing protein, partial [Rhodospirillales bacterium]